MPYPRITAKVTKADCYSVFRVGECRRSITLQLKQSHIDQLNALYPDILERSRKRMAGNVRFLDDSQLYETVRPWLRKENRTVTIYLDRHVFRTKNNRLVDPNERMYTGTKLFVTLIVRPDLSHKPCDDKDSIENRGKFPIGAVLKLDQAIGVIEYAEKPPEEEILVDWEISDQIESDEDMDA